MPSQSGENGFQQTHNLKVIGSNPIPATRKLHMVFAIVASQVEGNAQIAQSVEQRTENPRVAGSIPALGIFYWEMIHIYTQ